MKNIARQTEMYRPAKILSVCVARSLEEVANLKSDWRDLLTRTNNNMGLFQNFDWNMQWCKHWFSTQNCQDNNHEGNDRPFIVTVWQGEQLVSVWPLQQGGTSGVKTLSWLSSPALQYGDAIIDPECNINQVCQIAWNHITMSDVADLIKLDNIAATSLIYDFISDKCAKSGRSETSILEIGKFKNWDAYQSSLKKTARRARRKRLHKLARVGQLDFNVYNSPQEFKKLVDIAIGWKCEWLKQKNWPNTLMSDPKFKAFLLSNQEIDTPSNGWIVGELSLNGKPIAIEIGATYGDRYISFLGAYDLEYSTFSPGKVQLEKMIGWAHENGIMDFDLLCVSAQYKSDWTDKSIPVDNFTYACNLRGKMLHSVWLKRLRPALKYGLQHTPQAQRKMLASLMGRKNKSSRNYKN